MQPNGMHDRTCGHCGSRAFRIPVGSDEPALACRYCGKITMLDSFVGEAAAEAGLAGGASHDIGPSLRSIRPSENAVSSVRGSRQAVLPVGGR